MMNRPIDGVLVSATLSRSTLGERVYRDVTLRRRDGSELSLGQVTVSARLADVLVPGRDGRFYLHDVFGSQGLHAFEPASGETRIAFPMLVERTFGLLALLNLGSVAGWLAYNGALEVFSLMLAITAVAAWAACRGCREALLTDVQNEDRAPAAETYRQAVFRRPA